MSQGPNIYDAFPDMPREEVDGIVEQFVRDGHVDDNGDGTYSLNEAGAKAFEAMKTDQEIVQGIWDETVTEPLAPNPVLADNGPGLGPEQLQAALSGGMDMDEIRRLSPALGLAMDNGLMGNARPKPPTHHDLVASDDVRVNDDGTYSLTDKGFDRVRALQDEGFVSAMDIDALRSPMSLEDVNRLALGFLPGGPPAHLVGITTGSTDYLVVRADNGECQGWTAEEGLTSANIQELVGAKKYETVYLFGNGTDQGADHVMFVAEDGRRMPQNLRADIIARNLGAIPADIAAGLRGNVVVLGVTERLDIPGEGSQFHSIGQTARSQVENEQASNLQVYGMGLASTAQLRALSTNAEDEGLVFPLDPRLITNLDPSGTHVLTLKSVLDHVAGVSVPAFVRCLVMVKTRFSDEPVTQRFIDVRLKDYVRLETPTEYRINPAETGASMFRNVTISDVMPDERSI